jgi:hypothetical protein
MLLGFGSPVFAERQSLGIYGQWGAFVENGGNLCFAITEPLRQSGREAWRPFASVGYWPGQGVRSQLHFRLSRRKRPGSAVLLRIDERMFQLAGSGANAWAPDPRADADIVAAMRTGIDMMIETRSEAGAQVRDHYQLRGAATAIDAAAIACARRR